MLSTYLALITKKMQTHEKQLESIFIFFFVFFVFLFSLFYHIYVLYFSCETRPGPEFVLRKYLFRRNSFQSQIFYYEDENCQRPSHSISAKGSVKVNRPSWRTPGAYETRYTLSDISVIPYSHEKTKQFGKMMIRYCKQSEVTSVLPYKKFPIFQFTKYSKNNVNNDFIERDFDCAKIFNFTMNELQLVRIERRKLNSGHKSDITRKTRAKTELFLGDISTNMKYRRQYVPTHYQTPLVKSKVGILSD